MTDTTITYRDAGVDIDAANDAMQRIKAARPQHVYARRSDRHRQFQRHVFAVGLAAIPEPFWCPA